jgi:oxalate decarboxylase/phosphoglucose isomerase-like protein (cupin superfamily)
MMMNLISQHKVRTIYDATLIQFPKILDPRGNLTFIEQERHVPFKIARVYWIYDVPGGEQRGGHAFKQQEEVLIALSGSFDVLLDDGTAQKIVHLNRAYHGLYVPRMLWRRMQNFSTNAVAYVLASCQYSEDDYVRDLGHYQDLMRGEA